MYSTKITAKLRQNILSETQHFKSVAAVFWKSQNTAATPLERNENFSRKKDIESIEDGEVRPFEDIPGPKRSLKSIVESYIKTEGFTKRYKLHDRMFAKYGPIYKEEMMGRPSVHLMDPNDFEKVFRAEGKYPRRPDLFDIWREHRKRRNFVLGIFLSDDEEWHRLRHSVASKIMRPKLVEENIDNFNAVTKDAIARFVKLKEACGPDDHIPDLEEELSKWSTESIGTYVFDTRLGLYDDPPKKEAIRFINTVRDFSALSQQLLMSPASRIASKYIDTPTFKKFLKTADDFVDIGQDLVNKKIRELKEMAKKGFDPSANTQVVSLLTYLIAKKELTSEEINGMAFDMIHAGVDTTSISVLWMLYNLGRLPHVQDKVYQEIESFVGRYGEVTTKNLAKMSYLKACFKESMRLTPVTGGNMRVLDQDVVLSGYNVPAQTFVFLQEYSTARSEKYFKDPLEFKPERWLRGNKDEIHAYSNLPFGFGTRMCAGRRVAELEMYLFVCKLLQRFRLEYHHEALEPCQRMVNLPDKPVKVKFVDRL